MGFMRQDADSLLASFFRRSKAARAAGGISEMDRVEGLQIPGGWQFNYELEFWLPPNVVLL